jgi:hypothetical protein
MTAMAVSASVLVVVLTCAEYDWDSSSALLTIR